MKKTRRVSQGISKSMLGLILLLGIGFIVFILFFDNVLCKISQKEEGINIDSFKTDSTSLCGKKYIINAGIEDLILSNSYCGIYSVNICQNTNIIKIGILIPNNCYSPGLYKGQQFRVTAGILRNGFLIAEKLEKL
jgi:hypothetical protein